MGKIIGTENKVGFADFLEVKLMSDTVQENSESP